VALLIASRESSIETVAATQLTFLIQVGEINTRCPNHQLFGVIVEEEVLDMPDVPV